MLKTINYILVGVSVLLLVGCTPQKVQTPTPSTENNYIYESQELVVPTELANKLLIWTHPVTNYLPTNHKVTGYHKDKTFIIEKNQPTYIANFKNDVEIVKLRFSLLDRIEKVSSSNSVDTAITKGIESLVALPFDMLGKVLDSGAYSLYTPSHIAITNNKKDWEQIALNDNNKIAGERVFEIDYPFGKDSISSNEFIFKILAMNGKKTNRKKIDVLYLPDELTYLVKDKEIEKEVFKYNLKTRNNDSLNEELIRTIAVNNPTFFRELQREKHLYNISSVSLLKLPNDVSVNYGLKNFSKIIKTGRYKTYNNRYRTFNVKKTFAVNSSDYKKATKNIYLNNKNHKVILKTKQNNDDSFIDFDKGI